MPYVPLLSALFPFVDAESDVKRGTIKPGERMPHLRPLILQPITADKPGPTGEGSCWNGPLALASGPRNHMRPLPRNTTDARRTESGPGPAGKLRRKLAGGQSEFSDAREGVKGTHETQPFIPATISRWREKWVKGSMRFEKGT